jgi:hypothetical protein
MKTKLQTLSVSNPVRQGAEDDDFLPIPGVRAEKIDLAAMQSMANENDILLPTAMNVQIVRQSQQEDSDDILLPTQF